VKSALILSNVLLAVATVFTSAVLVVTFRACSEAGNQLGLDTSWTPTGCTATILGTKVKIPLEIG
jgi:hypothetical protein